MKHGNRLAMIAALGALLVSLATCLCMVVWILQWTQLVTLFPPEHVYVEVPSPDGSKIARFSVRHQGLQPWFPSDIEPYCYLTIVDGEVGALLLRKTEHYGDNWTTFTELARKYAPWAVEEVASQGRAPLRRY